MGGYKQTDPVCYVVSWPDGVIKAGYSHKQRWRAFLLRGGRLDGAYMFPTATEAFALETVLFDHMLANYPKAFQAATEAAGHLGTDGGGWVECFRPECPDDAVASCIRIANAYVNRSAPSDATNGRDETNVLTKIQSPADESFRFASRAGGQSESIISAAVTARNVLTGRSA